MHLSLISARRRVVALHLAGLSAALAACDLRKASAESASADGLGVSSFAVSADVRLRKLLCT
jgi:hypothetical protein